jgi:hypothetical protein
MQRCQNVVRVNIERKGFSPDIRDMLSVCEVPGMSFDTGIAFEREIFPLACYVFLDEATQHIPQGLEVT